MLIALNVVVGKSAPPSHTSVLPCRVPEKDFIPVIWIFANFLKPALRDSAQISNDPTPTTKHFALASEPFAFSVVNLVVAGLCAQHKLVVHSNGKSVVYRNNKAFSQ